jgi:hypothetical protein
MTKKPAKTPYTRKTPAPVPSPRGLQPGDQVGQLVAVEARGRDRQSYPLWAFRCPCGKVFVGRAHHVVRFAPEGLDACSKCILARFRMKPAPEE